MIVRREDRHLVVSGATFAHRRVLGALPAGRWDPKRRAWVYPATPVAAANLLRLGSTVELQSDGAIELAAAHTERSDRLAAARGGDGLALNLPPELWRHQKAAVWVASVRAGHLLAYGMRSGKTLISLTVISLCSYQLVLVVCPKKVIDTWGEQAEEHGLDLKVVGLKDGSTADRLRRAQQAAPCILVINYESVWREPFGGWALEQPWDLLIADEVHRLAAPGGKASRYMARLAERVEHRIGLSGTPVGDGPINAYGIFRTLDAGVFGTSAARFRAQYVNEIQLPSGVRIPNPDPSRRYRNEGEFNARYNLITMTGDRDLADMPAETDTVLGCALSGEAARVYSSMRDELVAELQGGKIVAANALVKATKLHQIAAGHVKHEDGRVEAVHHEKGELLAEVLDELGPSEPLVVMCWYVADLARIRAAVEVTGRECLEVSGRSDDLREWKAGRGSVLAVQIQAGGVGVDLSRARHCVFWTACFSHPLYVQARARLLGQKRSVAFTHLVARGTIDEGIYRALQGKKDLLTELLRAPEAVL